MHRYRLTVPKFILKIAHHSASRLLGLPPPLPYKLALSVTNRCNLRCKLCNVWTTYQGKGAEGGDELSVEELRRIFEGFGRDLYWLAITGGEPFLRTDLEGVVAEAVEQCRNLMVVSFVTNGSQPERVSGVIRALVERYPWIKFAISVSIDGEERLHDYLRGGKGIHRKAVETLNALECVSRCHPGLSVMIETLVSTLNLREMPAFMDGELMQRHEHCFAFSQESDRYLNVGRRITLRWDAGHVLKRLIESLRARARARDVTSLLLKCYYALAMQFFKRPERQVLPCFASFASIYVDALGNVRPCVMTGIVGNLRQARYDITAVLRGGALEKAREKIMSGTCPNCWTPCEALQTIIQNFPTALAKTAGWAAVADR